MPDVDADSHLEQIVNTLYWRLRNVLAAQYSYHSRSLTHCQGGSGPHDAYIIKRHFASRGFGGVYTPCLITDTFGLGCRECSHAEYRDDNFASQTGKDGIAFALKMMEHQNLTLVELRFNHFELLFVIEWKVLPCRDVCRLQ